MLIKIKQFFNEYLTVESSTSLVTPREAVRLAAAALLIEVARADYQLDERENAAILETLRTKFDLDPVMLDSLVKLAEEELNQSASLYQFTRLVNDFYSYSQKLDLISQMWEIAFADGHLDKYEEHLIRKVAELTYVEHKDFIRLKLATGTEQFEG